MDQQLRELERQAQTDHAAALQLISSLKRMLTTQWSAVTCSPCKGSGYSYSHGTAAKGPCARCDGHGSVRVNVLELKEKLSTFQANEVLDRPLSRDVIEKFMQAVNDELRG